MEWIDRLNQAIDYIEENLSGEISYEQLGKIACCSAYHFQRMFAYMAGVTLSEYVRRRKMSLAAVDLQGSDAKIVDVALKYGYSSPTAFNRAFQSVHGIAPSAVRSEGVSVRTFTPMKFRVMVTGAEEMKYRIETKRAFRIVGASRPLAREIEKNFAVVPGLWQEVAANGMLPKLAQLMNADPMGLLGVSACNDEEEWKYMIAVSTTKPAEEGMEEYLVSSFTWAIFSGEGVCPQAIQELERRIVLEWLPASGYEYDNGPDIEVYLNADPQQSRFEVWIPVVKKTEN